MTERDKMLAGQWYDANYDPYLLQARTQAMDLCFELNGLKPSQVRERLDKLRDLLGCEPPENLTLLSPFMCDYGTNIHFGRNVFVNINCYFMDGASISIGDNAFIGPSCGFYTANHPLAFSRRNIGLEQALPITIEENVWLGANVTVLPGVTIGSGCVIAAGSVVTKDIPANHLAAGVPCQVLRPIDQTE